MKKTLAKTLLVLLSLGAAQAALAEGGRAKLDEFFTQVDTVQAGFSQQVTDAKGATKSSTNGTFYLSRPGKFRWDYNGADKQQIVSDGKNVWVYDVGLDQVTVKPMRQALSSAPVGLLMQKQAVEKQFSVEEMESENGGNLEWFRLTPHKKDTDFTSMDVGVGANGVQEMILNDKFGQTTDIKFNGLRTNPSISPDKFNFTPPAGVDVVGKAS